MNSNMPEFLARNARFVQQSIARSRRWGYTRAMFGGKITTSLAAVCLMVMICLAAPAWAAKVGPLHGTPAPSLPALGTPAGITTEELVDTSFPIALEDRGDTASALLEWQRIAHKAFGKDREQALTQATRLAIVLERPQVANALLTELLTENPATPYAPQALYHIATGPDAMAAAKAFGQLQGVFPQSEWTAAAQMNDVWHQAENGGKITKTYNLPQAETLKKRVQAIRTTGQAKLALAGAMGVIAPGLGHMVAGNIPQGVAVLIIWCLFTLAFLSACRHRHYAYAFLFVIPAAALWLTGPVVAMQLAKEQTDKVLHASLAKWADLRPVVPTDTVAEAPRQPDVPEPAPAVSPTDLPVPQGMQEQPLPTPAQM